MTHGTEQARRSAGWRLAVMALSLGLIAMLGPALAEEGGTPGSRTESAISAQALGMTMPLVAEMDRSLSALEAFIVSDLPFLRDQRLARVAALRDRWGPAVLPDAATLERLLDTWRLELAYGEERDSWRGLLVGDGQREVDYLRLGRVGLYYLTPDGQEGGVWKDRAAAWQRLKGQDLAELRKAQAILRERRAPELLRLPVSLSPTETTGTTVTDRPGGVGAIGDDPAALLTGEAAEETWAGLSDIVDRHFRALRDEHAGTWLAMSSDLSLPKDLVDDRRAAIALLRQLEARVEESARWRRFEAPVADSTGRIARRDVARLGGLMAFSDGDLLQRSEAEDQVEPRLTVVEGLSAEQRELLKAAWSGGGSHLLIDPSGGPLLEALAQRPTLEERFHQGGAVGYAVVALGGLGLLVALLQYLYLLGVSVRLRRQLKAPDLLHHDNPLGRVLARFQALRDGLPPEALEARLDEALLAELPRLERGQALVKLLAAVAPLLGLLGTVVGMIVTFQAITVFGTGDPQLMAGGISQALVTTVLGLITAVPLLFAHTALVSRSRWLGGLLEGHASAALAEHLESPADGEPQRVPTHATLV